MSLSASEGVIETVALASLVLLPELQPRAKGTDPKLVERYRQVVRSEGAEAFPPLKVARLNGASLLYDGWHRYEAMRREGVREGAAELREATSLEQVTYWAFEANRRHGRALGKADLRAMFGAYRRAGLHRQGGRMKGALKSYRDMAADLGIPKSTLARWTSHDAPTLAKALAERDGLPSGRRGGARMANPERRLAREAGEAMEAAAAALAGVSDPEARWRLLDQARGLVETLETGELREPDF